MQRQPRNRQDLYKLPAASEALQSALMAARLASASRSSDPTSPGAEDDALASATAAAASVVFSAPAVRKMQLEGQSVGEVFSLCLDGGWQLVRGTGTGRKGDSVVYVLRKRDGRP